MAREGRDGLMLRNLWTGLKLALLLPPVDTKNVRISEGAVWFPLLALLLGYVFYSWLYLEGPFGRFAYDGFEPLGFLVALIFLAAYLLGFLLRATAAAQVKKIVVLCLNAAFWVEFFNYTIYLLIRDHAGDIHNTWWILISLWYFLVFYKIILMESVGGGLRELAGALVFAAVFNGAFYYFDAPVFMYEKYDHFYHGTLTAEGVFARQGALLDKALAAVQPSLPGHRDFYLVSLGPDARQDVFRKESLFAQKSFDKNAGTADHSLTLANSEKTAGSLPLATLTNLDAVLHRLGKMIQPNEDALILYVTSHGSDDATLETYLPGISLYDINGKDLRKILDRSRFKWRVVVISACYAGSFIEPLKNDNTLVITAASADRNSFGCSDTAALTYFGEAFLKDALPATHSLPEAYAKAKTIVAGWEKDQQITPSQPQIYIGAAMKDYLQEKNSLKRK